MIAQLSGYETIGSNKRLFEITLTNIGNKTFLDVLNTAVVPLTQAMDNSGPLGQPLYLGWSPAGSTKSSAKWRICKFTYSSNKTTDIQWADGVIEFNKVWNDRATYTYS